ncbi:BNR repeat-containing family member [Kordia sp. SMS9]|uniref:BNR-4 repeat-containing protein n=1 Tax=Kordia sp. SMS9 TaxID=2282170 RepID=UPI000E0CDF8C|nr:BNR-4 repeat-containing protein [Kordia sp. SMS9]AXG71602.1 BNR repeat-containing family member [Kordia sp. SMS9]
MKFINYASIILLLLCISCVAQNGETRLLANTKATSSESYQSMTFNGVWSWFSDPRAVYFEGKYKRTYAGWIDNYGDVHIGFYDHETKQIASKVIYDNLEIDDHNNPTILLDDDGRLLVFFNTHLQESSPLYMRTSVHPEAISAWSPVRELFLNDTEKIRHASVMHHTYTNPVQLSAEDGNIYLFWRGTFLKPSYAVSSDQGKTWSTGKILFMPEETNLQKSPYTKVYSDGVSKIHFTFTDGHPTKEAKNGLYYMYYENGAFYKADGQKIKEISQLPMYQSELDVIFESDMIKSWNWDIAQDAEGNPIVTYAKFPNEETHIYAYATFENNQWKSYDVVNAGGWFPKTRAGTTEPEPHYAGGIVLDHESPNTIYLSVKRDSIFEIEQWTTNNRGKSWNIQKITENSTKDNVRPFAVRGAQPENLLQVMWLQNTKYMYYAHDTRGKGLAIDFKDRFQTAVKMNVQKPVVTSELTKENITLLLRQIAELLLENPKHNLSKNSWDYGVYEAGILAFYELTKEARYENELLNVQQYQTEEIEDSDEDFSRILDLIWSPTAKNDRNTLQKIEKLTKNSFKGYRIDLEYASLLYVLRNFESTILELAPLKKQFVAMSQRVADELNSETFKTERFTRQKFLLIYGLAAGINDGLIDKKYTENVLKAWKESQSEIFKKGSISIRHIETSGAILLAGKEVFEILNVKD